MPNNLKHNLRSLTVEVEGPPRYNRLCDAHPADENPDFQGNDFVGKVLKLKIPNREYRIYVMSYGLFRKSDAEPLTPSTPRRHLFCYCADGDTDLLDLDDKTNITRVVDRKDLGETYLFTRCSVDIPPYYLGPPYQWATNGFVENIFLVRELADNKYTAYFHSGSHPEERLRWMEGLTIKINSSALF